MEINVKLQRKRHIDHCWNQGTTQSARATAPAAKKPAREKELLMMLADESSVPLSGVVELSTGGRVVPFTPGGVGPLPPTGGDLPTEETMLPVGVPGGPVEGPLVIGPGPVTPVTGTGGSPLPGAGGLGSPLPGVGGPFPGLGGPFPGVGGPFPGLGGPGVHWGIGIGAHMHCPEDMSPGTGAPAGVAPGAAASGDGDMAPIAASGAGLLVEELALATSAAIKVTVRLEKSMAVGL